MSPRKRRPSRGREPARRPSIGVGMLGTRSWAVPTRNAYRTIPYMTRPPLVPRLVAVAGRSEEKASPRRPSATASSGTSPTGASCSPTTPSGSLDVCGPNYVHAEASIAAAREWPARALREAARPRRRRELRGLAGGGARGRRAPVRLQLPLRAGRPPREGDHRRRRAGRDPPLPRQLPAGVAGRSGRSDALAPQPGDRRVGRPRRPRRARHRPGALPGRRGGHRHGSHPHVHPRASRRHRGRGRRLRGRRRVRRRGRRHPRGLASLRRPQERPDLGDQRRQRARSPSTSSGSTSCGSRFATRSRARRRRLPHRAGDRGGAPLRAVLVAAGAHHRLGAHVRPRDRPPPDGHRRRTAPWGRTVRRSRTATGRPRSATRS